MTGRTRRTGLTGPRDPAAAPSPSPDARSADQVAALHSAGLLLTAIAVAGALAAFALPAVRNTALER